MTSHTIKVLALDLEGTLIANISNPVPRPGLYTFLEWCKSRFERIVIYTCVDENKFRSIAGNLIKNKSAPPWFKDIDYIEWDGMLKDLYNIDGITPKQAIIVDDAEIFILDNQKSQWIKIITFDSPYPADDDELSKVAKTIGKEFIVGDD
jgi:hypothetical protein